MLKAISIKFCIYSLCHSEFFTFTVNFAIPNITQRLTLSFFSHLLFGQVAELFYLLDRQTFLSKIENVGLLKNQ